MLGQQLKYLLFSSHLVFYTLLITFEHCHFIFSRALYYCEIVPSRAHVLAQTSDLCLFPRGIFCLNIWVYGGEIKVCKGYFLIYFFFLVRNSHTRGKYKRFTEMVLHSLD